ncbi:ABC transporter permease [Rhodococcus rhodochrous]|uniref:ABC transporter permease n=1 Tax=Rhodococcus rhodochrous TaxID=1829 RepID=UPI0007CD8215|nr:ABC transporter permease [Rhodococcus rhodochrous]MDO1485115.1 ABC transporter permease [Rhodococcus rhodochrous]SNV09994.1 ABC transporter permease [Rhodococcus rhodochrous]
MSTTGLAPQTPAPPLPPRPPQRTRVPSWLRPDRGTTGQIGITTLAVAVALLLSTLLVAATGGSPSAVAAAIVRGSLGDSAAWTQTLLATAPLLLVALGACIASRAGVFNIGQEGQVLLGAMGGTFIALRLPGPPLLVIPVSLLAGAALGGLLAAVSALLYRIRQVNIVVSTLLLSFVAVQVVSFAVSTPWLLQEPRGSANATAAAQSALIPADYRMPAFGQSPGLSIGLGLVLALVATVAVWALLSRSTLGFRLDMIGLNPVTARHAGVRVALIGTGALVASGAFAGLAGAVIVESSAFRLQPAVSNNYGWDGLLVALIARNRPLVAIPVALAFGALRTGSNFLAATGVPIYLVNVVQSLLVLAFVIAPAITAVLERRRISREVQS